MRELIKRIPIIGPVARVVYRIFMHRTAPFTSSNDYWIQRYRRGGNSGAGSYKRLAEFKAEVLNRFVVEHDIKTVIEYGCGDGNQLSLADYPDYLGFDLSPDAIGLCRERFDDDPSKRFLLVSSHADERAELTLSLDVIYHLVEDAVFDAYMRTLFDSADRFVIIYSSNTAVQQQIQARHVRHRVFSDWIEANRLPWALTEHIPNRCPYLGDNETGSFADFYVYSRS